MALNHPSSCIAFIDVESACGTAYKEIILEQLASMDVTGHRLSRILGIPEQQKISSTFQRRPW